MKPKCTFCIYETSWGDMQPADMEEVLKDATATIQTENGPRDVCEDHAKRGGWTKRFLPCSRT